MPLVRQGTNPRWRTCAAKKIASGTHALLYLMSRNRASSFPSCLAIWRKHSQSYANTPSRLSNWETSEPMNFASEWMKKFFAGQSPVFTTIGSMRSVAQWKKRKAFRACEVVEGEIEYAPI